MSLRSSASATTKGQRNYRSMLRRVWHFLLDRFLVSFNGLITVWRLALHWVNSYILYYDYGGKPANDFHHKAVLIGDGLAQGFGSWVSLGNTSGPMRYLNEEVRRNAAVKMEWVFFERGALHSTTQDWMPHESENKGVGTSEAARPEPQGEIRGDHPESEDSSLLQPLPAIKPPRSLLDAVLSSRSGRDACVYIVMVGLQDLLRTKDAGALSALAAGGDGATQTGRMLPSTALGTNSETHGMDREPSSARPWCRTVSHLRAILLHLLAQPHSPHVCLCTLPTVGVPSSLRARAIKGVNAQIASMVRSLPPVPSPASHPQAPRPPVTLVDLSQRRVSRPEGRALDGVHFNSTGYKSMATAVLEELAPVMVRHEWAILQGFLSGKKRRDKRRPDGWLGGWLRRGGREGEKEKVG